MQEKRDTGERLLDAAEKLFAERGFEATSMRDVTRLAGTNLASVNYHFRSKEGLIRAVFQRRLGPLNLERVRMLDEVESSHGGGRLPLEPVLRAFFAPVIHAAGRHPHFVRLVSRLQMEPSPKLTGFFHENFQEIVVRFCAALMRALPDLPEAELFWRIHFAIGAMCHCWTGGEMLEKFTGGLCRVGDSADLLARLVAFCAGGLAAPPPPPEVAR